MGETPVEPGKIHADDRVRLPIEREPAQLGKHASELRVIPQHIQQPKDRVIGHVHRERDTGRGHSRPARSKESRLQGGAQRLGIRDRNAVFSGNQFP